MSGLVVVQHKVDDVSLRTYEDDLEDGVVGGWEVKCGPEKVEISWQVDEEV